MSGHTRTPWRLWEVPNPGASAFYISSRYGDGRSPNVALIPNSTIQPMRANAEHIVRCVNVHDEFVAAAEAALAYDAAIRLYAHQMTEEPPHHCVEAEDLDLLYADWIDRSRTALDKARS